VRLACTPASRGDRCRISLLRVAMLSRFSPAVSGRNDLEAVALTPLATPWSAMHSPPPQRPDRLHMNRDDHEHAHGRRRIVDTGREKVNPARSKSRSRENICGTRSSDLRAAFTNRDTEGF